MRIPLPPSRSSPGFARSYLAVLRRELFSLLVLPQTYAIAAAYVIVSGIFFVSILGTSQLPDLERFYSNVASTLVVLVPIISVRGIAEERATGSLDVMLSWPLSRAGTVLAKFTANVLFAWVLISVSWIYVRILSRYGTVEIGKQVAGFLGLMALAAAFSAVSLAVTARSSSVAGGAFLSVLVLLSAWSIQYAENWPFGETLAGLSPARRIEAAEQGVLYPSDLTYFVVVVLLGLGVTLALLERQRGVPRRRYVARLGVLLAGLGVTSLLLGVVGAGIDGQVDLTPSQRYTLTAASRQIARAVDEPIAVTAFVDPATAEAVQIRNLHRRYRAAGVDMSLDVVDPDREPGRMKAIGVSGYGQLLLRIGEREEMVDHFGEIALTSAIYRVGRVDLPSACFTTGHGERSIESAAPEGYKGLASSLNRIGYEPWTVALAAAGGVEELKECDVVVVAGGTGLLELDEVVLLDGYLAGGGRLVLLAEGGETEPRSMNRLLETFGVEIRTGTVRDTASLANDPASIVCLTYPSESPVTKRLDEAGLPTLIVGGAEVVSGTGSGAGSSDVVTPVLQTTADAWVGDRSDGRKHRDLGVAIDRSDIVGEAGSDDQGPSLRRTRVGVVGSVEVGSNRFLSRFGNEEFVTSLVQWTAAEAEIISAVRDPGGVRKVELTDDDQDDIVRSAVILPGLAALVPLPVAVRRMRRS